MFREFSPNSTDRIQDDANYSVTIAGVRRFDVPGHWIKAIVPLLVTAEKQGMIESDHEAEIIVPLSLVSTGRKKIAVIKEIRALTGMNLKDSKAVSDRADGYSNEPVLLGRYPLSRAEQIKRVFHEAGAVVSFPSALDMLGRVAE